MKKVFAWHLQGRTVAYTSDDKPGIETYRTISRDDALQIKAAAGENAGMAEYQGAIDAYLNR